MTLNITLVIEIIYFFIAYFFLYKFVFLPGLNFLNASDSTLANIKDQTEKLIFDYNQLLKNSNKKSFLFKKDLLDKINLIKNSNLKIRIPKDFYLCNLSYDKNFTDIELLKIEKLIKESFCKVY